MVLSVSELSRMAGILVEDHPFDCGYWSRIVGQPRPSGSEEEARGWDVANQEIAEEAATNRKRLPLRSFRVHLRASAVPYRPCLKNQENQVTMPACAAEGKEGD